MPVWKSTALDDGPSSAVTEPIIQPSSFSPEINDDDLDMLMNNNRKRYEIPAFQFKLTANKSYGSTDVGTISDH
jgi:hypothetical protein